MQASLVGTKIDLVFPFAQARGMGFMMQEAKRATESGQRPIAR